MTAIMSNADLETKETPASHPAQLEEHPTVRRLRERGLESAPARLSLEAGRARDVLIGPNDEMDGLM
jgi:hypothetical protein